MDLIYVSGESMWPTLRDGELVRGGWCRPASIRTGSIIGFEDNSGERMVVHRFVRLVRHSSGGPTLMRTMSDGSGPDSLRPAPAGIFAVRRVLRAGRWIRPGNCRLYSALTVMLEVGKSGSFHSYYGRGNGILRRIGRWLKGFEAVS